METFGKKEREKKKQQKKMEKEQRKADRKANAKTSKSWEDMIAYIDENGNITSTPPDPNRKKVVKEADIVIGSRNTGSVEIDVRHKGKVTYFNDAKGYGFIRDLQTQESIFVHSTALAVSVKENDFVTFLIERGVKGLTAVSVKKI